MNNTRNDIAVAVYERHADAEAAVKTLQRGGFDMKKISIVARDYETEEHVIGFLNAGDRAKIFGRLGAFWGALLGVLFGSAMLFIPVLGHVVVLGPLAAVLFEGAAGAVVGGGVSALAGALTALGVPRDSVLRYEVALQANRFLLIVHGVADEIELARGILKEAGPASFDHHEAPANVVA